MATLSVPWNDSPLEFPDEANEQEINDTLKLHPNYPTSLKWRDAAEQMGMWEASAINKLPFGVGEKAVPSNTPGLQEWESSHPIGSGTANFVGGTLGYVPAAIGTEAAGGGMLAGTGIFGLYNMLDKYVKSGKITPEDAYESFKDAAIGMGFGKILQKIITPHPVKTEPLPPGPEEVVGKEANINTPAPENLTPRSGLTPQEQKMYGVGATKGKNINTPNQTQDQLEELLTKINQSKAEAQNKAAQAQHQQTVSDISAQNAAKLAAVKNKEGVSPWWGAVLGALAGHYIPGMGVGEGSILGTLLAPVTKKFSVPESVKFNQFLTEHPRAKELINSITNNASKGFSPFSSAKYLLNSIGASSD